MSYLFANLRSLRPLGVCLVLIAHFSTAMASREINQKSVSGVPAGWSFRKVSSDSLFRAHPNQIGTLQESGSESTLTSKFLTAVVIARPLDSASSRTSSAKLIRLENEVAAYLDRQKSKPAYRSAKIIDDVPTIELEYGKSGKGLFWVFAAVKEESILIIAVDSREAKPAPTTRQEFFAMARSFKP
jgi:hypothetical protein